mmetsp:Transcript_46293/g.91762  ORF Transcript_46293/g.91762 Transcript_46293/m.91762 type:complete len:104 (-) Transcript_46293:129-440(-)
MTQPEERPKRQQSLFSSEQEWAVESQPLLKPVRRSRRMNDSRECPLLVLLKIIVAVVGVFFFLYLVVLVLYCLPMIISHLRQPFTTGSTDLGGSDGKMPVIGK